MFNDFFNIAYTLNVLILADLSSLILHTITHAYLVYYILHVALPLLQFKT